MTEYDYEPPDLDDPEYLQDLYLPRDEEPQEPEH